MKKIFAVMALFGGLTLAAADPYFDATIRRVDVGGEVLSYANITVPTRAFNNTFARLAKIAGREEPSARSAFNAILKLLDLTSFKAIAHSSVEVEPKFFVYKDFVRIDSSSESIFGPKAFTNCQINYLNLPADTRLALMLNINFSYIWKRINDEVAATGDQKIIHAFNDIKAEAMKEGFNIDKIIESINGPVFLLVTGESIADLKVLVFVSDKSGVISTELRKVFPTQDGEKVAPVKGLPLPGAQNAQLIYGNECVVFVSDPKILTPEKKLGDLPRYQKYSTKLPKEGFAMLLVDMSQPFADTITALLPEEAQNFLKLKPFSITVVETSYPDGIGAVAASSFSVPMCIFNSLENFLNIALDVAEKQSAPTETKPAPAFK